MLTLHAPAKVNLSLRVLAREESGFHQLETLFASLEFGDTVSLSTASRGVALETDGPPMGPPEENLVHRAAKGFLERGGISQGVEIHLEKRIPVKGGLGGGSSDAAATLSGMDQLFPGALSSGEVMELAAALGSDVPYFLSPSPLALAWGRGDRMAPLPPLPTAWIVLALPPVGVATPEAFGLLASGREGGTRSRPSGLVGLGALSSWDGVAAFATNDFEEAVFPAFPILKRHREALEQTGPLFSLLSGSGSALFAVYLLEEKASEAVETLENAFPDSRFLLTRTLAAAPG